MHVTTYNGTLGPIAQSLLHHARVAMENHGVPDLLQIIKHPKHGIIFSTDDRQIALEVEEAMRQTGTAEGRVMQINGRSLKDGSSEQ